MTEWERCRQYLEPALDEGWTIEAVEQEIRAGGATFWPMERSAVVTQIKLYPKGRFLRIWLAGGDMDELLHYLPAVDNYARATGCIAIEFEGRPGWERVLKGFGTRRIVMVRELNG